MKKIALFILLLLLLSSFSVQAGIIDYVDDIDTSDAQSIYADGTYVYIADGYFGLRAYSFIDEELTLITTKDDGGFYEGIHGDGTYIYTACRDSGLRAYSFDGSTFTLLDTHLTGGDYADVFTNGTYIYTACEGYGLRAYSFNGVTLSLIDTDVPGGSCYHVFAHDEFVYTTTSSSGLRGYTFNGATLTLKDTYSFGFCLDLWGDDTYVYVAHTTGLRALYFDGITFASLDYETIGDVDAVFMDGTYIYTETNNDIETYKFSAMAISEVATDDTNVACSDLYAVGNYLYASCYGSGIYAYRIVSPSTPTNVSSVFNTTSLDLNITWDIGADSDTTLVRKSVDDFPSSTTDGTLVYNGTSNTTIEASINQIYKYTLWGYNATMNCFSSPAYLSWNASWINCYNETDGSNVTCWDVEISNSDGSQVYNYSCANNSLIINTSQLPTGNNVIFHFSADDYESRSYIIDITDTVNLDAYLPPTAYGDDEATEYLLHILDDFDRPVDKAKVEIRRYVDGEYEPVLSELTDGNGDVTVYLITDAHYKIVISKTNYTTSTAEYFPTAEVRTKTFILSIPDTEPQDEYIPQEHITFTGEFGGGNLYVNFSCDLSTVEDISLYIYETDITTGSETLYDANSTNGTDSWNDIITGINTSNSYRVVIVYNHSLWDSQTIFLIVNPIYSPPITQDETDTLFDLNYGGNPFGWSNFFLWIFMAMVFTKADKENAGFILMMFGVLCMFISYVIGFNTVMSTVAGGVLPMVMIVVGVLSIWVSRR